MESETTQYYYCPWATDDLQTCINHVVELHGEKLLKIKAAALDKRTGTLSTGAGCNELVKSKLRTGVRLKWRKS